MALKVIVSYDGTTHDDDALVLAKMVGASGATLELAYVRHTREYDPRREELAEYDAARRLEQGALWLQDPDITRHVVVDPSPSARRSRWRATRAARVSKRPHRWRPPWAPRSLQAAATPI